MHPVLLPAGLGEPQGDSSDAAAAAQELRDWLSAGMAVSTWDPAHSTSLCYELLQSFPFAAALSVWRAAAERDCAGTSSPVALLAPTLCLLDRLAQTAFQTLLLSIGCQADGALEDGGLPGPGAGAADEEAAASSARALPLCQEATKLSAFFSTHVLTSVRRGGMLYGEDRQCRGLVYAKITKLGAPALRLTSVATVGPSGSAPSPLVMNQVASACGQTCAAVPSSAAASSARRAPAASARGGTRRALGAAGGQGPALAPLLAAWVPAVEAAGRGLDAAAQLMWVERLPLGSAVDARRLAQVRKDGRSLSTACGSRQRVVQ
jgi:hypothetical protein